MERDTPQLERIFQCKFSLDAIDNLEEEGIITKSVAREKREKIRTQLDELLINSGIPSTDIDQEQQLITLKREFMDILLKKKITRRTATSRFLGLLSCVNIIWVLAIFMIVIACGAIFAIYILPDLVKLPATTIEALVYFTCFMFIFGGKLFSKSTGPFVAFTGCIGLIGAYLFSLKVHATGHHDKELAMKYLSYSMTIAWTPVAIAYESSMIGFATIVALECSLGFIVIALPFGYLIGFTDRDAVARAMTASFILLFIYCIANLGNFNKKKWFRVFEDGTLFMGSFVYFLGALIISNEWYQYGDYTLNNIIAITSGLVALFLGSWDERLDVLKRIGGTFFILVLIEKYAFEIPWDSRTWSWGLFFLGWILYGISLFVKAYPSYTIGRVVSKSSHRD